MVLLIIGFVGANGLCLWKVVDWGIRLTRKIVSAINEHTAAENREGSNDSYPGNYIIVNDDIGPKTITAKQRRLGVR